MLFSKLFALSRAHLRTGIALAVLCILGTAGVTRAEEYGYYVAPQFIRCNFQLDYIDKSLDRFFRVETPAGKFGTASGGFRYDPTTKVFSGFSVRVSAGSLTTPDKDFTWKLLAPDMFDVNKYEEITLESIRPVTFVNDVATLEARLVIHGFAKPLMLTAKLNYVKDSSGSFGFSVRDKTVGLTLRGTLKMEDYQMKMFDDVGRSLGDQIAFVFDMQGTRQ